MHQPDAWITLTWDKSPPDDDPLVVEWGPRPLANRGGLVEGRILAWTDLVTELSDDRGTYKAHGFTFLVDDNDGVVRALLDDPATKYAEHREVRVNLQSEAARKAGLVDPRVIWRGLVDSVHLEAGRRASFRCVDLLGSVMSRFDLEKQIPQHTLGDAYGEEAREEVRPHPLQIIYGEHSDHGAFDAEGRSVAKGLIPAIFVRDAVAIGEDPFADDRLERSGQDPGWIHGTQVRYFSPGPFPATVGIIAYICAIHQDGKVSNYAMPLHRQAPVEAIDPETGQPILQATDTWVPRWVWPTVDGVTHYRIFFADTTLGHPLFEPWTAPTRYGIAARFVDVGPGDYITSPLSAPAFPDNPPNLVEYKPLAGFDEGKDYGVMVTSGSNRYGEFHVAHGPLEEILDVFGSDLGASGQADAVEGEEAVPPSPATTPHRVRLDASAYGTDVLAPGKPGWPFAESTVTTPNGYTVTSIYVKGALLDHVRTGQVTLAVNVCGRPGLNGQMIDQAFYALQDILSEFVLGHDGQGYIGGPALGIPVFRDGTPMLASSEYEQAQQVSIARTNTAKGYVTAFALVERVRLRTFLQWFCQSTGCFVGPNQHGQPRPVLIDHDAPLTDGPHYRDPIHLAGPLPAARRGELVTTTPYVFDWDTEQRGFRQPEQVVEDGEAVANLRGAPRREARIEQRLVRDFVTARNVIDYRLAMLSTAPLYQPTPLSLWGLERDLGDPYRLTHPDGLGAQGYAARPFIVMARRIRLAAGLHDFGVELLGLDRAPLRTLPPAVSAITAAGDVVRFGAADSADAPAQHVLKVAADSVQLSTTESAEFPVPNVLVKQADDAVQLAVADAGVVEEAAVKVAGDSVRFSIAEQAAQTERTQGSKQKKPKAGSGDAISVTFDDPVPAGAGVLVHIGRSNGAQVTSIEDNADPPNVYTRAVRSPDDDDPDVDRRYDQWYVLDATGASELTITVNIAVPASSLEVIIEERDDLLAFVESEPAVNDTPTTTHPTGPVTVPEE